MLITISFAAATNMQIKKTNKEKITPLFGIRTSKAIGMYIQKMKNNLNERFEQRLFLFPHFRLGKKYENSDLVQGRTDWVTCMCTSSTTCKCNLNNVYQQNEFEEPAPRTTLPICFPTQLPFCGK